MALGLSWDPTKILIAHGTERRTQKRSLLAYVVLLARADQGDAGFAAR